MFEVEITQPTEYTDRGFATALWWEKVELQPGRYPVVPWSNIPYYFHFKVPAIVLEDYFASNFAGANVQFYDQKQNSGKPTEKWIGFPPGYMHNDSDTMKRYLEYHPTFNVYHNGELITRVD